MQRMGLTNSDLLIYQATVCVPHMRRVKVALLDLDHNPLTVLEPRILSGQITADTSQATNRSLSCELLDPYHDLDLDTDAIADGAMFLDRLVQVSVGVWVPLLNKWVWATPFTGVPQRMARSGPVLQLEAHSKERLALRAAWKAFERGKHANRVVVLHDLLAERAGETKFAGLLEHPAQAIGAGTLDDRFTVAPKDIMWEQATKLADPGEQLFYDGPGFCTLRGLPDAPAITFTRGNGGALLTPLAPDTNVSDFYNAVQFQGKKGIDAVRVILDKGGLRPAALTRGGVPGVVARFDENTKIKTKKKETAEANRLLGQSSATVVSQSADVIPFYHLDDRDMVAAEDDGGNVVRMRLERFAMPLVVDGAPPMTIGYDRRLTPNRSVIRSA